jgi:geranylgeranyl diphosphate synthase type I
MFNELKRVAEIIDTVIKNDIFPNTVEPDYLQKAMRSYPQQGGKRLRPALLLWSCALLGGDEKKAIPVAAAVEIYHNWTLVHDDIIDNDNTRRNVNTAHIQLQHDTSEQLHHHLDETEQLGKDMAILAGDLQQAWSTHMLLNATAHGVSSDVTLALLKRLQELVARELISGEALDVAFPFYELDDLSPELISKMLYKKTGALMQFCCEAGAVIALNTTDFNHPTVKKLGKIAATAAVAFQLQDDWLGIFGDDTFGKPILSDFSEGKITLLLSSTLNRISEQQKLELLYLLGKKSYTEKEAHTIKAIIHESGAEEDLNKQITAMLNTAHTQLQTLPQNRYNELLKQLITYLVERKK